MTLPLFLNRLGVPEIIVIALVILLLFGGKKIPELMRGLGKGVNSFKQGLNDIADEAKKDANTADDASTNDKDTSK